MKKKKYLDNLTIEDLERNIGKTEISVALISTIIFISIFTVIFTNKKIGYIPAFAEISEVHMDQGKVKVSAEVPEILGEKIIDKNSKNLTFLVFGNANKGYGFSVAKSGELIYAAQEIPGDGNIIKIPNIFDKIIFNSYY